MLLFDRYTCVFCIELEKERELYKNDIRDTISDRNIVKKHAM